MLQIFFTMHVCGFHLFNLFSGTALICSTVQRWLTTAPGAPTTHWYQLRCVLTQPIYVMAGQEITGQLRMVAHNAQSYTLYLTLMGMFLSYCLVFVLPICFSGNLTSYSSTAKMWGPGAEQGGIIQASSCKLDLKEPYYRMSQPQAYPLAQDQQSHPLINTQVLLVITFELSFYMSLVHWHSWQLFPQKF